MFQSMIGNGAIAQLGERLHGMQEVSGSIPLGSTKNHKKFHILKSMLFKKNILIDSFHCDQ